MTALASKEILDEFKSRLGLELLPLVDAFLSVCVTASKYNTLLSIRTNQQTIIENLCEHLVNCLRNVREIVSNRHIIQHKDTICNNDVKERKHRLSVEHAIIIMDILYVLMAEQLQTHSEKVCSLVFFVVVVVTIYFFVFVF